MSEGGSSWLGPDRFGLIRHELDAGLNRSVEAIVGANPQCDRESCESETTLGVLTITADYDAGSARPGASDTARHWRRLLGSQPDVSLDREVGADLPFLLARAVDDGMAQGDRPLVLGGDHSLTWHVLEQVCDRYGAVTVVHFDAHHDAYRSDALNHYTVFHHIRRRLPVDVVGVGHRWECEALPDRVAIPGAGPVYLSVDVDYFSPLLVRSVMHSVDPSPGQTCDLAAFEESLSGLEGRVVGADIVEWCGSDDLDERAHVEKVLQLTLRCLGS